MLEQLEDIEDLKMLKIFSVQKLFNESFEGQNSPFSFLTFRLTWFLYPSCSHKIAQQFRPVKNSLPCQGDFRKRGSFLTFRAVASMMAKSIRMDTELLSWPGP